MNDYELIYLFKSYQDEDAFSFMQLKYAKFMWKIIHSLNPHPNELDDLYQESHMILFKAMTTFKESYQKSFTRYFELILKRHLYYLLRQMPKYLLSDEIFFQDIISPEPFVIEEEHFKFDHPNESMIYEMYFVKGHKVSEIARHASLSSKQVYNLIYRVKDKIKYMVKKSNQS